MLANDSICRSAVVGYWGKSNELGSCTFDHVGDSLASQIHERLDIQIVSGLVEIEGKVK